MRSLPQPLKKLSFLPDLFLQSSSVCCGHFARRQQDADGGAENKRRTPKLKNRIRRGSYGNTDEKVEIASSSAVRRLYGVIESMPLTSRSRSSLFGPCSSVVVFLLNN